MTQRFGAVVVAAGSSSRMGLGRSKVLEDLAGRPVIRWALEALDACPETAETVVVCREGDRSSIERAARGLLKPVVFAPGGESRQDSVLNGVAALSPGTDYILIHDGARPLADPDLISRVCAGALEFGAAAAAVPVKDTCKLSGKDGFVEATPPRESLYAVQTPQAFRKSMYLYAAERAANSGKTYTDDCQLIESVGGKVKLTRGDYRNLKITTPDDLLAARAYAGEKEAQKAMRIGYGYDVHKLVEGRKLVLGGVEIPFGKGLLGHSDADVLTHAAADAVLGAAALGDIGRLFPDDDPRFAGADSLLLLKEVCQMVRERGYSLGNLDCTLVAQQPKIAPYIRRMRENLAAACGTGVDRISVKATTEEGLGFTGSGEGMSASAVCLLVRQAPGADEGGTGSPSGQA